MSANVTFYRFEDSLTAKICTFLRSKGYHITDSTGVAHDPKWEMNKIGILLNESVITSQTHLFGLIKKNQVRRVLLGYISWNIPEIGATPDNWYFSFHENDRKKLAVQVAKELAEAFSVNIAIHPPIYNHRILERFSDEIFCDD